MKAYKHVRIYNGKEKIFFLHHWVLSLDLEILKITIRIPYKIKTKTYEDFFSENSLEPFKKAKKPAKKKVAKKTASKKK